MATTKLPVIPPDVLAYFTEMGRQGGLKGGKARAEALTPKRRKQIATQAVKARWAKRKKK